MTTLVAESLLILVLLWQSYRIYLSPEHWAFISNVNLIFHEAGHAVLFFASPFLHALAGTLMEVGVPLIIAISFWRQRSRFEAGFALWWLSTALASAGWYVRDAQERQLPLITGDPASHDWAFLLGQLGLLRYDDVLGNLLLTLSVFVLVWAVVVCSKHLCSIYTRWSALRT